MMNFTTGSVEALGPREILAIAASDQLARDGHILEVDNLDTKNYARNPVILANHDGDSPIGVAVAIGVTGGKLFVRIRFADEGISPEADKWAALAKGGVVNALSVGFDPLEMEPLDPKQPYAGQRITSSELLEISLVSVPADPAAVVTARAFKARSDSTAILRALPELPRGAVARVLDSIRTRADARPLVPPALLSPLEQMRNFQVAESRRCMTVWGLQQAERERERGLSYEERQADLARFSPKH